MLNKKIGLIALFAGLAAGEIMAGTLTSFTTGDLLLCFRNGGTKNLVVDVGQYTIYTNGTPNQRIPINQYTNTQIAFAFGDANNLNWSAFGWLDDNTLFVTKKRVALNTQSATPSSANNGVQASAAQNMAPVQVGANYQFASGPYTANSTAAAVVEPQGASSYPQLTGQSYYNALFGGLSSPTFGGTLSTGDPENVTGVSFSTSGSVVRSDLYQVPTGSGKANVKYLGYFELAPDGSATFVAKPSTIPVIKSISRNGNDSVISYTTGLYGTYTLRGAASLTAYSNQTNWPALATLVSGDTTTHSVTNTTTAAIQFYTITAQ